MNPIALLSPHARLIAAHLASLLFHLLLLMPWRLPQPLLAVPTPLSVQLPAPGPGQEAPLVDLVREPAAAAPEAVPPAPTSGRAAKTPRRAQATAQELGRMVAALSQEEFYPRAAIEQGLEGRVVLLLTIAADGRVVRREIARSSGHALLDEAALHAARRISALPPGPREVLFPVDFRLE